MPLYEYRCQSCEEIVEVLQPRSAAPKRKCDECGGRLEKLISSAGFVLKGSGWYVHEYGRGKSHAATEKKEKAEPKDATPTASPKAESGGGSSESKAAAAG